MNQEFVEDIKSWVENDNKINLLTQKIKDLRDEKTSLHNKIISYIQSNNLDKTTINITGGKIKLSEQVTSTPLTYKYLEEGLKKYFDNDNNKVEDIINYLKTNRKSSKNVFLKRIENK